MATAHLHPPPAYVDLAKIVETYVGIRAAKSAIKKRMEDEIAVLDEKLDALEAFLLGQLNSRNANSVATEFGTFYRQEQFKPSIADDKAFYAWVAENKAFDALYRRVSETFVKEYMESHKDAEGNLGPPPPGLNVHRFYDVRVRKSQ